MTSIHSNQSSIAALQTLRSITADMATTQGRVSSGLRVQSAADNSAYWSIATTMRSDSKAISVVADTLGMGMAKVDIAYTGQKAVIDVLSEFKAKLVASKEPGVDRNTIQKELEQLKHQANNIAGSSVFGGVNWLNTNNPDDLVNISDFRTEIVAGFSRSTANSISINKLNVDLTTTSLINTGGGGALQADSRSLGTIGGFRGESFASAGFSGYEHYGFSGPLTFSPTDYISFNLILDAGAYSSGTTYNVTIDRSVVSSALGTTDGVVGDSLAMSRVLSEAFSLGSIPASTGYNNNPAYHIFSIGTQEGTGNSGSSVDIGAISTSFPAGFAGGLEDVPLQTLANRYAQDRMFTFSGAFQVQNNVEFSFKVQVNGNPPSHVTVDRTLIDATLGTTDGLIGSATDMAAVLNAAVLGEGLTVSSVGANVNFAIDQSLYPDAGARSSFSVTDVQDTIGEVPDFDFDDVSITGPSVDIDYYITGVDVMIEKVVSGAAELGAIQNRIKVQSEFASTMLDVIDKGVGRLVDANMNKESTRLRAIQAQEQLATQSLSIANANFQNIISLFR